MYAAALIDVCTNVIARRPDDEGVTADRYCGAKEIVSFAVGSGKLPALSPSILSSGVALENVHRSLIDAWAIVKIGSYDCCVSVNRDRDTEIVQWRAIRRSQLPKLTPVISSAEVSFENVS